jgi:hypothetical protein
MVYLSPIYPVFVPPLYTAVHIRGKCGTNTGQIREKEEVGRAHSNSKIGVNRNKSFMAAREA